MLQLEREKVVVVGGGLIATRKIRSLLHAKAHVTVISPTVTDEIAEWASLTHLHWIAREFEAGDVQGAFLVIAATNLAKVNEEVYHSLSKNQLINMVDRPDLSNFIVPSSVHRGKLVIAVSTSGASPGLSRKIRQELSEAYDSTYEDYVEFLEQCRAQVLLHIKKQKKREIIFKELLSPHFLELSRLGLVEEREELFHSLMKREGPK
jgi:precorrin-2 dehydrogenase/sirohydrochlorin ferrochelatase